MTPARQQLFQQRFATFTAPGRQEFDVDLARRTDRPLELSKDIWSGLGPAHHIVDVGGVFRLDLHALVGAVGVE